MIAALDLALALHLDLSRRAAEYTDCSSRRAAAIRQAHEQGASWQQIADVLGVTRSAVSRFAKEVT